MYAKLEEDYGLAKRAMAIYERATQVVVDTDKFEVRNDSSVGHTAWAPKLTCFHETLADVYCVHCESYSQLWSSGYKAHIRESYRRSVPSLFFFLYPLYSKR